MIPSLAPLFTCILDQFIMLIHAPACIDAQGPPLSGAQQGQIPIGAGGMPDLGQVSCGACLQQRALD